MALKTRVINLRRVGRFEEAAADLKAAKDILAKHPRLSDSAVDFAELEDDKQ